MTKRARGFTLIELMVVVAIIGIISSLAAIGIINTLRIAKLRGASSVAAQFINNARRFAMLQHCAFIAILNGDEVSDAISVSQRDPLSTPNHAVLIRKALCSSSFPGGEPDDVLIDRSPLTDSAPRVGNLIQTFSAPASAAETTSQQFFIAFMFFPNGEYRVATGYRPSGSATTSLSNVFENAATTINYKSSALDLRGYARISVQPGTSVTPEYIP